jgi:hypothetical protein
MALSTIGTNQIASEAVTVPKVTDQVLSNKNFVINGDMQCWQRATAATAANNSYATVDRWAFGESTDGAYTSEQSTDTPTGTGFSVKAQVTTADTSIAAAQFAYIYQEIEAQNLQPLQYGTSSAKTLTLSFWVKSNKTGTYTINLVKRDSTAYLIPVEYTISSANTWEKKTITITPTAGSTSLITASAGAIANDNGHGIQLGFGLAWGSDYHGTSNTWSASSHYGTSNQVNWMDSTSNNFYLAQVQLEIGEVATPFEHEDIGTTLRKCQRYYVRQTAAAAFSMWGAGFIYTTQQAKINIAFPVEMRDVPSLGQSANNTLDLFTGGGTPAFTQDADINNPSTWATNVTVYCGSGLTAGQGAVIMANNSVGAYLEFKAEL